MLLTFDQTSVTTRAPPAYRRTAHHAPALRDVFGLIDSTHGDAGSQGVCCGWLSSSVELTNDQACNEALKRGCFGLALCVGGSTSTWTRAEAYSFQGTSSWLYRALYSPHQLQRFVSDVNFSLSAPLVSASAGALLQH